MNPTAPAEDLRSQRRHRTRADIATAALDLFEAQGVAATTTDEIALRAGVSPRTFFRYVASKEEAVLAGDEAAEQALAALPAGPIAPGDLLVVTERVLTAWAQALSSGPPAARSAHLRVRALLAHEAGLLRAVLAQELQFLRSLQSALVERLGDDADPLTVRVVTETGAALVRVALDRWADGEAAGREVDVDVALTEARARMRAVLETAVPATRA